MIPRQVTNHDCQPNRKVDDDLISRFIRLADEALRKERAEQPSDLKGPQRRPRG